MAALGFKGSKINCVLWLLIFIPSVYSPSKENSLELEKPREKTPDQKIYQISSAAKIHQKLTFEANGEWNLTSHKNGTLGGRIPKVSKIRIKKATSSLPMKKSLNESDKNSETIETTDTNLALNVVNVHDISNSYDSKAQTFFLSNDSKHGWAQYEISEAVVKTVRIQNRPDCCADGIKGNVVFICSAKTDPRGSEKVPNHDVINSAIKSLTARDANGLLVCNQCGVIEETVPLSHWAAVSCESDKLGTFVKVVSNTSYLQIAEIRIFGYPEANQNETDSRNQDSGIEDSEDSLTDDEEQSILERGYVHDEHYHPEPPGDANHPIAPDPMPDPPPINSDAAGYDDYGRPKKPPNFKPKESESEDEGPPPSDDYDEKERPPIKDSKDDDDVEVECLQQPEGLYYCNCMRDKNHHKVYHQRWLNCCKLLYKKYKDQELTDHEKEQYRFYECYIASTWRVKANAYISVFLILISFSFINLDDLFDCIAGF